MILSQLTVVCVGFWLECKEGESKWVDKLAISLVLSPLPSPFTDKFLEHSRAVCTCYSVAFPFNFHCLVSTKFVSQVEFPITVCSSKDWENDHKVDVRGPSQCLPIGIHCSLSFTTLLVSRKFPPGRENQQLCFLLLVNLLLSLSSGSRAEPCSLPSSHYLSLCCSWKRLVVADKVSKVSRSV